MWKLKKNGVGFSILNTENGEVRKLGSMMLSGGKRIFYMTRKPIHFFRKHQGFGFNKELVDTFGDEIDYFIIKYEGKELNFFKVSPIKVMAWGKLTKEEGFEEQYIVPINYMEKV